MKRRLFYNNSCYFLPYNFSVLPFPWKPWSLVGIPLQWANPLKKPWNKLEPKLKFSLETTTSKFGLFFTYYFVCKLFLYGFHVIFMFWYVYYYSVLFLKYCNVQGSFITFQILYSYWLWFQLFVPHFTHKKVLSASSFLITNVK